MWQTSVLFVEVAIATPAFSNHYPDTVSSHQHQGKNFQQQKDYDSLKAQMMVSIFSNKMFLIEICTLIFLDKMLLHT